MPNKATSSVFPDGAKSSTSTVAEVPLSEAEEAELKLLLDQEGEDSLEYIKGASGNRDLLQLMRSLNKPSDVTMSEGNRKRDKDASDAPPEEGKLSWISTKDILILLDKVPEEIRSVVRRDAHNQEGQRSLLLQYVNGRFAKLTSEQQDNVQRLETHLERYDEMEKYLRSSAKGKSDKSG